MSESASKEDRDRLRAKLELADMFRYRIALGSHQIRSMLDYMDELEVRVAAAGNTIDGLIAQRTQLEKDKREVMSLPCVKCMVL